MYDNWPIAGPEEQGQFGYALVKQFAWHVVCPNGSADHRNVGGVVAGSVYELVKVILRSVLMGDRVKRITNTPSDGNKEYNTPKKSICRNRVRPTECITDAENDEATQDDSSAIVSMIGSCHCKAVSFIVS